MQTLPVVPNRNKVTEPQINHKLICGERTQSDVNKLTIGSITSIQAWPWHATIYSYNPSSGQQSYRCGGVLVNDRTVLTAASCVALPNIVYVINLGQNKAFATSNQKSFQVRCIQLYEEFLRINYHLFQVAQILSHPQFYSLNLTSNIALLKLQEPTILSSSIQPVCLPNKDDLDIDGKEGKVVGFGYDENGQFNQNLKEADMKAEKYFRCLQRRRDFYRSFSIANSFCAKSEHGDGICAG
jgi:secreted trypsin-like serine protease